MSVAGRLSAIQAASGQKEKTGDAVRAPRYTAAGPSPRPVTALGSSERMPITLLDIVLIVVMLVSGLLAMVRGFMREILSITAWILAAGATLYSYGKLMPLATGYFNSTMIAAIAVVGGVFLATLLVVSVITIRLSDMVLDSRVGALDRTLGFLFGLARGLIIVVVAYTFFDWLVPDRSKPDWVMHAKSKVVLSSTGDWLKAQLPENAETTILNKLKPQKPGEGGTTEAPPADQRGDIGSPADTRTGAGYDRDNRVAMHRLIERDGRTP